MIKKVELKYKGKNIKIDYEINSCKALFYIPLEYCSTTFDLEITFGNEINKIRNNDYNWISPISEFVANQFSPKILLLSNGFYVMPNSTIGIWELDKQYKNKIIWKINPIDANLLIKYQGISNIKVYKNIVSDEIVNPLVLLFSKNGAIEFSRSKIPFSSVACFTDHCDFDTRENLLLQRSLLKANGIRVTKGFFLNHYSKRNQNTSWQNDSDELNKWIDDEHELAYHSLSQSIKSDCESVDDFLNFSPLPNVTTWIDHGFQPYNLSLYENSKLIAESSYLENLKTKKIDIFWNYIDSGTSTSKVLNQLNPEHFSMNRFWKGNNDVGFLIRVHRFIKNCIFHYYADETLIKNYKSIIDIKNNIRNIKFRDIITLIKNTIYLFLALLKVLFLWNFIKNKTFRFAKYNPILFRYKTNQKTFYVFQTIEMIDFRESLAPYNIDLLIQEKGVFIAHTYFSVPMKYHSGRMFIDENKLDEEVVANFNYLGQKIKIKEIWNPTLKELVYYWKNFYKLELDINENGFIFVKSKTDLYFRNIL